MSKPARITIEVTVRWWLPLYLNTLAWFCWTFDTMPDPDKLERMVERGIRFKVI